jgi:predicted glycoside hydrolase/deacetylase ChbG (UPF0249 family)
MNIIINADDFGADHNINTAIACSFEKKIIDSTTMMVNTDGFEEAVELAHKYKFSDKIGIHLNLTWQKSLTDLSNTGLTDHNGLFIRKSILNPRIAFSKKIQKKVQKEIYYQYHKLLKAKIKPTHIDSHHHVHTIPWLYRIFIDLALREKLKMRITNDRPRNNFPVLCYNKFVNTIYRKKQINFSDKFDKVSTFMMHHKSNKNHNLIYEVMVHPVFKDGILIDNVEKTNLEDTIKNLKKKIIIV